MKYLLLLVIKIYQTFIPKKFRGECLFKESCSNFVYRITKEEGFKGGFNAFMYRYHNCRPDYHLSEENGKLFLITVEKEVVEENLIDNRILLENKCRHSESEY